MQVVKEAEAKQQEAEEAKSKTQDASADKVQHTVTCSFCQRLSSDSSVETPIS